MVKSTKNTTKPIINVMLADDDEDDQMLFRDALESLHLPIRLIEMKHGKELMQYFDIAENPLPEIIFLDLNMPYLSGLECLPLLRKTAGLQSIPIAIYSTSSSRRDMEQALIGGANIYINKPNEFAKLQEIIKKTMEINWQYRNSDFDMSTFVMSI